MTNTRDKAFAIAHKRPDEAAEVMLILEDENTRLRKALMAIRRIAAAAPVDIAIWVIVDRELRDSDE